MYTQTRYCTTVYYNGFPLCLFYCSTQRWNYCCYFQRRYVSQIRVCITVILSLSLSSSLLPLFNLRISLENESREGTRASIQEVNMKKCVAKWNVSILFLFHLDGSRVLTCSVDEHIKVIDIATEQEVFTKDMQNSIRYFAFPL